MKKRGIGYGSGLYGVGFGFSRPDTSAAYVEVGEDGSVTLFTGCADMGQGSTTVLSQIAAEELGVDYHLVRTVSADTGATPDAGPSTASRQTYVSGTAVKRAAADVKESLLEMASVLTGCPAGDLSIRGGEIYARGEDAPRVSLAEVANACHRRGKRFIGTGWADITTKDVDPDTGQGNAYASYVYFTQVAEVEVDTDTGEVTVLRVVAAHDVGYAINPQSVEGQIEGACSMGIGYALTEEIPVTGGVMKTSSLAEYLIPTALDMPPVVPIIVEAPDPTGPFGAKGAGEPAAIPTAPAIINAIYHAVGVRITELPATPEKILKALGRRE
ncbi:MAG: molybdopterin cofactor-binding domain-containing protein [Bacillota bacterium]